MTGAVGQRAGRVGPDDADARRRQGGHLQPGQRRVRGVRAAVDLQHDRAPAAPAAEHPGVDRPGAVAECPHLLHLAPERPEPPRPVASDAPGAAALQLEQVGRPAVDVGQRYHPAAGAAHVRHDHVALGQPLLAAVQPEPHGVRAATVGDHGDQVLLVLPAQVRPDLSGDQVAVGHEGDRPVEPASQPDELGAVADDQHRVAPRQVVLVLDTHHRQPPTRRPLRRPDRAGQRGHLAHGAAARRDGVDA